MRANLEEYYVHFALRKLISSLEPEPKPFASGNGQKEISG